MLLVYNRVIMVYNHAIIVARHLPMIGSQGNKYARQTATEFLCTDMVYNQGKMEFICLCMNNICAKIL